MIDLPQPGVNVQFFRTKFTFHQKFVHENLKIPPAHFLRCKSYKAVTEGGGWSRSPKFLKVEQEFLYSVRKNDKCPEYPYKNTF